MPRAFPSFFLAPKFCLQCLPPNTCTRICVRFRISHCCIKAVQHLARCSIGSGMTSPKALLGSSWCRSISACSWTVSLVIYGDEIDILYRMFMDRRLHYQGGVSLTMEPHAIDSAPVNLKRSRRVSCAPRNSRSTYRQRVTKGRW